MILHNILHPFCRMQNGWLPGVNLEIRIITNVDRLRFGNPEMREEDVSTKPMYMLNEQN
jgi:hypothetical protein